MKITLEENELTQAICSHLKKTGLILDNKKVDIDFTSGRGPNGTSSATIDITDYDLQGVPEQDPKIPELSNETEEIDPDSPVVVEHQEDVFN